MSVPLEVTVEAWSSETGLQVLLDSRIYRFPKTKPAGIRQRVLVALALYFEDAETLEVLELTRGRRRGHYVAVCRVVLVADA